MDSTSVFHAKKVVWHDANLNTSENMAYSQDHFKDTLLKRFDRYEEAGSFLQNDPDKWIVVTSGTNGLDFVKLIHSLRNVIEIIVFCGNKKYHEEWAQTYPKVQKVVTKIIEVEKAIDEAFGRQIVYVALKLASQAQPNNEIHQVMEQAIYGEHGTEPQSSVLTYHLFSWENNMQFKSIEKIFLKEYNDISPIHVLNELINLNPKSEACIRRDFEKRLPDVLRAILYLYSADYFYEKFNQICAAQKYHRLPYTLASCLKEIRRRPDLRVEAQTRLFRGVNNLDQKKYSPGSRRMYWPAFTSTSCNVKVAEAYARESGSIFEILLSNTNPHPHAKLGADWVRFPAEDEVLLFPHFPFRVKSKQIIKGRTWIVLEQDESDHFFSLDQNYFMKYWKDVMDGGILSSIEEIFEQQRIVIHDLDLGKLFYEAHRIILQRTSFIFNEERFIEALFQNTPDAGIEVLTQEIQDAVIEVLTQDADNLIKIINENLVLLLLKAARRSETYKCFLNNVIIERAMKNYFPIWINMFRPLIKSFRKRVILKIKELTEVIQPVFESIASEIMKEMKPEWLLAQQHMKEEMEREKEGIMLFIEQEIKKYFENKAY